VYFIIVISNDSLTSIKVYVTSDGRDIPLEGRPHYNYPKTIDTTYIIRRPFMHLNHITSNNFIKLQGYPKLQVHSNYRQFVPIASPIKSDVYKPVVAPLAFPADGDSLFDLSSWRTKYEWDTVYESFDDYLINNLALFDSHQVIFWYILFCLLLYHI